MPSTYKGQPRSHSRPSSRAPPPSPLPRSSWPGVGAGVFTAGLAAPAIGAAVGGTVFGLYGAAATSAGLAALGGGSLAAGGLGMAGGTAVISAAGGLLGLGVGAGAATGASAVSEAQLRVLGRLVSEVVKVHVLCKVVLIDELQRSQGPGRDDLRASQPPRRDQDDPRPRSYADPGRR